MWGEGRGLSVFDRYDGGNEGGELVASMNYAAVTSCSCSA